MMRLLARLHGSGGGSDASDSRSPWLSILVGAISSGIVLAHLLALAAGGVVLVRSDTGLSQNERIALSAMAVVAVLAFGRAASVLRRTAGDRSDENDNGHHHEDGHHHSHHRDDHHHSHHRNGLVGRIRHTFSAHSHDHGNLAGDRAFADNQLGIRTVWISLAALTITSIVQLIIMAASGSVSLLADTAHNVGDAANSIPLLIALYLGRRVATARFTYGYGRAEDVAGIIIVLSIFISATIVFWESSNRLFDPKPLQNLDWLAVAAIVGFLGNEAVALLQIRVGNRIGSAALVSDGLHARTDGLTSLAVLIAAGGAWLGLPLVDPIVGMAIGIVILLVGWEATKRIWGRLMDSVEPELIETVRQVVTARPNVLAVEQVRLRYVGHRLHGDLAVQVSDPSRATSTTADIRHELGHEVSQLADLVVEITEPSHR